MDQEKSSVLVADHDVINKENVEQLESLDSDEEFEEIVSLDKEKISSHHSSIITYKYKEDMEAPIPK